MTFLHVGFILLRATICAESKCS